MIPQTVQMYRHDNDITNCANCTNMIIQAVQIGTLPRASEHLHNKYVCVFVSASCFVCPRPLQWGSRGKALLLQGSTHKPFTAMQLQGTLATVQVLVYAVGLRSSTINKQIMRWSAAELPPTNKPATHTAQHMMRSMLQPTRFDQRWCSKGTNPKHAHLTPPHAPMQSMQLSTGLLPFQTT